ncbi:MAG: long-chain fatty acid--CoA ligase [Actinomycetales bacterium]|jgi:long-chain acyl-CoA synthetase|nr:long-chain fatty acid--CoA ligase [Candidatus Phosphoribacter baldrii]MBK6955210.1 long-chain fatty acid--CoA ligase [Candidatus Phosphoribacter baldrii]
MTFNLSSILRDSVRRDPAHPAIVTDAERITYGELNDRSDAVAAGLIEAGLQPGGAVMLQLPNVPEFVVSLHGILKAGGVVIPTNTLYKAGELSYVLENASAKHVITVDSSAGEAAEAAAQAGGATLFVLGQVPSDLPAGVTARPFADLAAHDVPDPAPFVQRDPGDTAVLLYTSGTTGKPKGVQLTHFQLYMNAGAHIEAFEMGPSSRIIAVMPLFHALGLSGIMNATVRAGGTVLLLPKFDTEKVLQTIQAEGATHIHGVPTMYHSLLNHPTLASFNTSTLAFCGSAGAAIAAEIIDQVEQTFGVQILEMYGLTESGPVATINMPRDRKPYSIGKAIPGVDIEIWDEHKNRLPRGKLSIGEIMIRGHNTMSGYLNNPEATAAAFTNGWLHTGDLAWMDEDGFLFFADRKKELIIRGGYNVYPREVEEVLYTHPKVSEAAVVGVPDERLGEEIKAYLTLKPGEQGDPQEFIDYVKERLAAYKYPRIVEVIPEMPKSATGKILKKELANRG